MNLSNVIHIRLRPCGHGFCYDCAKSMMKHGNGCLECSKRVEKILGLSAPVGPDGKEEMDFEIPIVMLDMKTPFQSVNEDS